MADLDELISGYQEGRGEEVKESGQVGGGDGGQLAGGRSAGPERFFGVFERWFLVALPKGPLEALLGF